MAIIQGNAKQGSTRGFYPKVINGSLRFNDDDSAYLTFDPAADGDKDNWSLSFWFKRANLGLTQILFGQGTSGSNNRDIVYIAADDTLEVASYGGAYVFRYITTQKFRDPSAWYHLVISYQSGNATASDRLRIYLNGERITSFSISTDPSLNANTAHFNTGSPQYISKFIDQASSYLDGYMANVHFIDGQALTASDFGETKNGVWVAKDYAGTFGTNGFYLTFEDDTEVEAFNTTLHRGNGGTQSVTGTGFSPDLVWIKNRDNADNHYLYDTVRGANRYLNSDATGAEAYSSNDLNSFDTDGFTVGSDGGLNRSGQAIVAWQWDAGANNASTGHSSVTYTGNGGTQKISGLPFSPDLVWVKSRTQDEAQNHNLYDTVRGANVRLRTNTTSAEATDNNALMSFDKNGFTLGDDLHHNQSAETYVAWAWDAGDSDFASNTDGSITSTVKASTTNGFSIVSYSGVAATDGSTNGGNPWGIGHGLTSAPDFVIYKMRTSSNGWYVYHSSLADTEHLRLDLTAAKATETNLSQNTPPDASKLYVGGWDVVNRTGNDYIAYCWHDVAGKQKFGTYTGNGSTSGPSVTLGFRAGWILIKRTDSASVNGWYLYDGSRNTFSPWGKILLPNSSGAEGDNTDDLIISDTGFTLNDAYVDINASGGTYIYAAFAGSYSDYITDYNTDGSIDSRVKASDTTGFSIVSYEGTGANATVGHGLSSAPDMVIVKTRDSALDWPVFHTSLGGSNYVKLNATNASTSAGAVWNSTAPTNSVIHIGTNTQTNNSGDSYIAYCWAEKTGYSKFGSYTGNGSTSGPTVTCGFKPSMVIIKGIDSTPSWFILDSTRDTDGKIGKELYPDLSIAEGENTAGDITFSDTGFQITASGSALNALNDTFIYAAFADTREVAFWLDQSGNDNDWQPVNLDHNDTVADSPTNNFATWNPLNKGSAITLKDGNLSFTQSATWNGVTGTVGVSSGQWYFEYTYGGGTGGVVGVAKPTYNPSTEPGIADTVWRYRADDGTKRNGGASSSAYGATWTTGDVIGVAYDLDAGTLEFYKNGVSQGVAFTNLAGETVVPVAGTYSSSSASYINFGQQPFKYDPPA